MLDTPYVSHFQAPLHVIGRLYLTNVFASASKYERLGCASHSKCKAKAWRSVHAPLGAQDHCYILEPIVHLAESIRSSSLTQVADMLQCWFHSLPIASRSYAFAALMSSSGRTQKARIRPAR